MSELITHTRLQHDKSTARRMLEERIKKDTEICLRSLLGNFALLTWPVKSMKRIVNDVHSSLCVGHENLVRRISPKDEYTSSTQDVGRITEWHVAVLYPSEYTDSQSRWPLKFAHGHLGVRKLPKLPLFETRRFERFAG